MDVLLGFERRPPKADDINQGGQAGEGDSWQKLIADRILEQRDGDDAIKIEHCAFVPTRPRTYDTPHQDEEDPVSTKDYIDDEVALLTEMLAMTLSLPNAKAEATVCDDVERDLRARLLFLKGLVGPFARGR